MDLSDKFLSKTLRSVLGFDACSPEKTAPTVVKTRDQPPFHQVLSGIALIFARHGAVVYSVATVNKVQLPEWVMNVKMRIVVTN